MSMDKFIVILIFGSASAASSWIPTTYIQSNSKSCCIPKGLNLIINCTRNSKLFPTKTAPNISLGKRSVGSTTYKTIHESIDFSHGIQVSIPNVSENDSADYRCCWLNNCTGLRFTVGEPPLRPNDFECVIYNTDYMECTWTSVEKCAFWSIKFETIPGPSLRSETPVIHQTGCHQSRDPISLDCYPLCTCAFDNRTTCVRNVWRLDTPELDVLYNITLIGTGLYGTSSHYYNITSSYVIEKLGNLSGCRHSFNGTTVAVCCLFPLPSQGFTNGIECNITAESRYSSQFDTIRYTEEKEEFCYHLENSHPYTSYTVSLMCQVSRSLFWGNPHVYSFTTPEDVPLVGPSLSKQSYTAWCRAEKIHILIYIQPPSQYQTQGELTGYHVRIDSSVDSWNRTFNGNKATLFISDNVTTCGVSVKYDVIIWSQTKKGDSMEGTPLSITANSTSMPITEVFVEERNSGYLVSWKGRTGQSSNCTYHWCLANPQSKGNKDSVVCQGQYNFRESTATQLLIPLEKNNASTWQFGVSQKDTGIKWQDCVFANGPPLRKPDRLFVTVGQSDIKLSPMPFCSQKSRLGPRPSSYFVLYSNLNNNTDDNITLPASLTTAFSSKQLDLRAKRNYSVKYKILYSDGLQSDYSDEVFINTPVKDEVFVKTTTIALQRPNANLTTDAWKTLGAVIGGIVFLSFLLISVYKAHGKWKNIDDNIENVAIPDPDSNEHCYQEVIEKILTKSPESGLGTLSSTATSTALDAVLSATHPLPNRPRNFSDESHSTLANNDEESTEEPAQCPSVVDGDLSSSSRNDAINIINSSQVMFSRKQNTDYIQIGDTGPKFPSAVVSNCTESCLSSWNSSGKSECDSYRIISRNRSGTTNSGMAYSQNTTEKQISTLATSSNMPFVNDRNVIVQSSSSTPSHSVAYRVNDKSTTMQSDWDTQRHDIVCDVLSQNTTENNCFDKTNTECDVHFQSNNLNSSTSTV